MESVWWGASVVGEEDAIHQQLVSYPPLSLTDAVNAIESVHLGGVGVEQSARKGLLLRYLADRP